MNNSIIQTTSFAASKKEWGRVFDIISHEKSKSCCAYSISLIEYEKPHFSGSHDDTEIIFIRSGKGKARIGEQIVEIHEGSLMTIPKNVLHGISVVEESPIKAFLIHLA